MQSKQIIASLLSMLSNKFLPVQEMMRSKQMIASLFSNSFEQVSNMMQSIQTIATLFSFGLGWPGPSLFSRLAWAGLGKWLLHHFFQCLQDTYKIFFQFFSKSSLDKGLLRTAILAVKNGNFKTQDFSPLIKRVLKVTVFPRIVSVETILFWI